MPPADKGRAFVEEAARSLAEVARWFRATERVARGYQTPVGQLRA